LKAGAAYVPLDPAYPKERLEAMLQDARPSVVLTEQRLLNQLPAMDGRIICLDSYQEQLARESRANPAIAVTANNLTYVIYTSGSTGMPKGVMVEHRSLVNYTVSAGAEYAIAPGDRVLQFASFSFDASAEEIYPCLTRGATLVLRTESMLSGISTF